ncbi:MAG: S8 family serine peptidase [Planctomycetes bacterium]|nr:S8 family serine peptidase [Planctomycetota bacterium]
MRNVYLAFLVITFAIVVTWPRTGQCQKDVNISRSNAAYVKGELLVQFKSGSTDNDKASAYQRVNAEEVEVVLSAKNRSDGRGDLVLVRHKSDYLPQAAVNALNSDPSVEFTEQNWVYTHQATSNDTYYTNGQLWGMYGASTSPANQYGSNAAAAWANNTTGSKQVYVGIIDEGIQFNHKDLKGQVWVNPYDPKDGVDNDGNGYKDDKNGWDFDGNDKKIYDGGKSGTADDHGTHVSGTIGGIGGNGMGVVGVNWNITLISAKFLGRNGGTTANAVKAVDYITDLKTRHGLNIVATNNSWGGGGFSQALQDAIERANTANILFIAAAGNGGNDGIGDNNDVIPNYPSNYPNANIIAVASITSTGARSSFSNYGVTTVDIGAPGSGIWSTTAFNTYSNYNGTSMATPHVTGAAALYASTHLGATAAQIKNAILSSAVPTASLSGKVVTGGRLDANAALSH